MICMWVLHIMKRFLTGEVVQMDVNSVYDIQD